MFGEATGHVVLCFGDPGGDVQQPLVDLDPVGEVTDPDAALSEVVDEDEVEVEGVVDGAAQPAQGVHHEHVIATGVSQCRFRPGRSVVAPDFLSR